MTATSRRDGGFWSSSDGGDWSGSASGRALQRRAWSPSRSFAGSIRVRFSLANFSICVSGWRTTTSPTGRLPPLRPAAVVEDRSTAHLRWADTPPHSTPRKVVPFVRAGKRLTPEALDNLRRLGKNLLSELIELCVVREEWPETTTERQEFIRGYRVAKLELWDEFFRTRRFRPAQFADEVTREGLQKEGWTDHYLRAAIAAGVIAPVYEAAEDDILAFVKPKEGVGDLTPNPGQQAALDSLCGSLDRQFGVTLLHGVTGSGKTSCTVTRCAERLNRAARLSF